MGTEPVVLVWSDQQAWLFGAYSIMTPNQRYGARRAQNH